MILRFSIMVREVQYSDSHLLLSLASNTMMGVKSTRPGSRPMLHGQMRLLSQPDAMMRATSQVL
jgi:hypothetical protein